MNNNVNLERLAKLLGIEVFLKHRAVNPQAFNLVLKTFSAEERKIFDELVETGIEKHSPDFKVNFGDDQFNQIKENNLYKNINRFNNYPYIFNSNSISVGGRNLGINKVKGAVNFSTSSLTSAYYKDTVVRKKELSSLISELKELYTNNMDEYEMDNVIKLRKMIMQHEDFLALDFKDKIISLYGKNNKLNNKKLHSYKGGKLQGKVNVPALLDLHSGMETEESLCYMNEFIKIIQLYLNTLDNNKVYKLLPSVKG